MLKIKKIKEMQKIAERKRLKGKKIGFVPTMGSLHKGHLNLIRETRKVCDFLVVSIFINPIQFAPEEDYKMYPKNLTKDLELCETEKVDCVFIPSAREMYPESFSTYVSVKGLTETLCGKYRPGHFTGVTTVVNKLFNIVKPHISAFGWKDAQQLIVIKRMVEDLNMDIEILPCETVREKDGLAMSSRNSYLKEDERKSASVLYQSLKMAKELIKQKKIRDFEKIRKEMEKLIQDKIPSAKIQYIETVDLKTLQPVKKIKDNQMIALAVFIGKARLIDNILI